MKFLNGFRVWFFLPLEVFKKSLYEFFKTKFRNLLFKKETQRELVEC